MSDRSQALISQSRASIRAIEAQLERARICLSASRELLARAESMPALLTYGANPPWNEMSGSSAADDATRRTFAAVTELIEQVEDAASRDADLVGGLIEDIILAIPVLGDPSLLMGILLEGLVETVLERLSANERRETAIALCTLLWDRINQGTAEQD